MAAWVGWLRGHDEQVAAKALLPVARLLDEMPMYGCRRISREELREAIERGLADATGEGEEATCEVG